MEVTGNFRPYLKNHVEDRLGCHRLVYQQRWIGEENIPNVAPTPRRNVPLVRTEHNSDEDGGQGVTAFYFEGVEGDIPEGRVSYEFQGSFNQEPITSHPNFGALLAKYQGRLEDGEVFWAERDPTKKSKRKGFNLAGKTIEGINPMYGITAYLAIGAIWSVTRLYISANIPPSLLSGVGTIRNPPGGPPTPSGRNWLKLTPVGRTRGNVLEIADCYMMSGLGGWNPEVYDGSDITGEAPE